MFSSVSDVILTDVSFVFLSALKLFEKWLRLILNPKSVYYFGLKFLPFNKVLCA